MRRREPKRGNSVVLLADSPRELPSFFSSDGKASPSCSQHWWCRPDFTPNDLGPYDRGGLGRGEGHDRGFFFDGRLRFLLVAGRRRFFAADSEFTGGRKRPGKTFHDGYPPKWRDCSLLHLHCIAVDSTRTTHFVAPSAIWGTSMFKY